jgi:hypothetical protein
MRRDSGSRSRPQLHGKSILSVPNPSMHSVDGDVENDEDDDDDDDKDDDDGNNNEEAEAEAEDANEAELAKY